MWRKGAMMPVTTFRSRRSTIVFVVLLALAFFPVGSRAQDSNIQLAVSWLESNQDATGLWGVSGRTPGRDSAAVLLALLQADADSLVTESGVTAFASLPGISADHRSRAVIISSLHSGVNPNSAEVEQILAFQNTDGGWGFSENYESNALDTALALLALQAAGYSDAAVLGQGVGYLSTGQNFDGGWRFLPGQDSQLAFTSQMAFALAGLQDSFDISSELGAAAVWLESQVQADGGYGELGSSAHETGFVLAALVKADPNAVTIAGAEAWLRANQLPDGSWGSDAYSTAMAVFGLHHLGPDVAVGVNDIVLSNPAPSDDETISISVTVHNHGLYEAEAVQVLVFDGEPDLNGDSDLYGTPDQVGVQISTDMSIATLPAGADSTLELTWNTFGLGGDHEIYVLVDPNDTIRESDEFNNIAIKAVHVYFPADLIISDIIFDPEYPDPEDDVIIRTTVQNVGETTADNISLQLWDGDPDAGGTPLMQDPFNIVGIGAGSYFTLNLNMGDYFGAGGSFDVYACADREDTIREIDEANNCGMETLSVGLYCDPLVLLPDLNLLGLALTPAEAVTAYGAIGLIDNFLEIHGWDAQGQRWQSAFDPGSGPAGEDFPIGETDGFFVGTSAAGNALFCGTLVNEHGCGDLQPGLNLISVPSAEACYTGFSLIGSTTNGEEAHAWDAASQTWLSALKLGPDNYVGEDFPVTPGHGYFLKAAASEVWCSADCDTITDRPDLYVTDAYVWITQNPIDSGAIVGIYVNMDNIGTVVANWPRLDIFLGDPASGGENLIWFNIPMDVPPGGSTGYWGSNFVITGSGSVAIHGIADYAEEIIELEENNNEGVDILYFTTARGDMADAGAMGDRRAPLVVKPLGTKPHLHPGLPPPRLSLAHAGTEATSASPAMAPAPESEPATRIEEILVAQISSRAASIHWRTDACGDGRVDFGPTPDLGLSTEQNRPHGRLHRVELRGLEPATEYHYRIISGGLVADDGGEPFTFTTAQAGFGQPDLVRGRILDADSGEGLAAARIEARLLRDGLESSALSALASADGNWLLNLGNLKDADGGVLESRAGDRLHLRALGTTGEAVGTELSLTEDSPQDCGPLAIVLSDGDDPDDGAAPASYYLAANHPNPFNPVTTIRFGLPAPGRIDLAVYDILGRRVAILAEGRYEAGHHEILWQGRDDQNHTLASGIYFYKFEAPGFAETRKMTLLK